MKKTIIYLLILCGLSCQENNNLLEDITIKGGFISFVETPLTSFSILELDKVMINAELIDENKNALSYTLAVEYNGLTVPDFVTINSFPGNLEITLPMLLNEFNITENDITLDTRFHFSATVVTSTGTFTGFPPDFNNDTNEQEGGNTVPLLLAGNRKNAFVFNISFFLPPPEKIRGTSFEEPVAGTSYTRPGGATDELEFPNNPGQASVMYVATGSGQDDEIGFKSEFIDTGRGGFTTETIGVTESTTDVGAFLDGKQGFRLQDIDGIWKMTFDRVTIPSGIALSGVQIQFYIPDVGNNMESSDLLHVYAFIEKDGGNVETLELFNEDGITLNDMRNRWVLIDSGLLENIGAYTLIIEHDTNSNDERIYFDQMLVYKPDN